MQLRLFRTHETDDDRSYGKNKKKTKKEKDEKNKEERNMYILFKGGGKIKI